MSDFIHDVSLSAKARLDRIWPQTIVGIALSVTVVWTCVLAYSFVRLVDLLI